MGTDVYPANYVPSLNCTAENILVPGVCVWASIQVDGVGWLNASVTVAPGGQKLVLQSVLPSNISTANIIATSYAYGPVALMNAYDKATGLPVLQWNQLINATNAS